MEIRWSLPAAEDLEQICEWIERDDPKQPVVSPERSMTVVHACGIFPISDDPAVAWLGGVN